MRTVLGLLFIFVLAISSLAQPVNLAWDSSLSDGVAGYGIFEKNFQKPYNFTTPLWLGTSPEQLSCTVTVPDDRATTFTARAYALGPYDMNGIRELIWSDNSNEVVQKGISVDKPDPPGNLIVRILKAFLKLFTNLWS